MINRGGGAALRTGYRLMADSGASVVVTLDADGQHLPEEMSRLVAPILDGEVDMAHGSRVIGHAEPNHFARELGIVFFNRMVSLITRTKVSDCSNGYRAVRASVLPQLVLRQEQFHTSEFMIEAIKRGFPRRRSRSPSLGGCTATPRSRPSCGTGSASRTRSCGPGFARPLALTRQARRKSHERLLEQVPAGGAERDRDGQHDDAPRARRRAAGRGRAPRRSAGCATGRGRR